ncbi:sensor histidine kinase [Deinococcus sp. UYEF24]
MSSDSSTSATSDRAALEAFATLTQAALQSTDLVQVAQQAVQVLQRHVPDLSVILYSRQEERLVGLVISENVPDETTAAVRTGLPITTPAFAQSIQQKQVVFADLWNADEQEIPGAQDYSAAAFYPYFQDGELQHLLAIGSMQVQWWDEHTRIIFTAVGRSLDLARQRLEADARREQEADLRQRLETAARLELERQELDTFVAFTEAASQISDVKTLAELAVSTLETLIPDSAPAVHERRPPFWSVLAISPVMTEDVELARVIHAGFPLDMPLFAEVYQTREPVFVEDWDEEEQQVEHSGSYRVAASIPVVLEGEVVAVLTVGCKTRIQWTERDRSLMRSVGRSFSLLYERISTAQQLQLERAEAISRARALEAFSTLTEVLDVRLDRYTLIRRAQELALSLLPPGYAAYLEPEDGLWRVKSQVGDVGLPALQAAIDAGFPVGATPTIDRAMNTGEPYFIDVYVKDTDIDPEVIGHLNAGACLPLYIRGQFTGIFNVPLFETRIWDATDRAVLISVMQSLTLALEGAQSLAELTEQAKELAQSNQSLQLANDELEAFTYSASHDLRTPVRHVMGFAELAQSAYQSGKLETGKKHLNIVKQAATRMTALIDGMLVLSRSGRQELNAQPVDLQALVAQAQQDVETEFAGHPVVWEIGDLPLVKGDRGMLQQVVTNLLSNAVKYSGKRERSEVKVWGEDTADGWRVSVQDNGVGFDPKYAEKLFGIFQRLHTEREFRGTGVGLATVRRIVLKHGGQVFAESPDETGATFGFTIPKGGPSSL